MLKKSGQLNIRTNLIRLLAIEVYKCVNGINPKYLNDMFIAHVSNYNFRNQHRLVQPQFKTHKFGYKSFKYFGSKIWNSLPSHIKSSDNIDIFKKLIYKWCLTDTAIKMLEQLNFQSHHLFFLWPFAYIVLPTFSIKLKSCFIRSNLQFYLFYHYIIWILCKQCIYFLLCVCKYLTLLVCVFICICVYFIYFQSENSSSS